MKGISEALSSCRLFTGLSISDIQALILQTEYTVSSYTKNQLVAVEGEICNHIGIIIKGGIEIQKSFASGRTITVTTMNSGNNFGEVMVFSDACHYPSTIVANDNDTIIVFISQNEIIKMCKNNGIFLLNLMKLLSNKLLVLNNKIKYLSYQTIRQKTASFILDQYKKQKNLTIVLSCSRKEMAELLAVPRPSLSRELANMKTEGLINFEKNIIRINMLDKLEELLI